MGIATDTLSAGWAFGPVKGLSSDVEVAVSISGIYVHPMKDLIPIMISLQFCSCERVWSGSVAVTSGS